MAANFASDCEGFNRRNFLRIGAGAGLLGLSLPELLKLEAHAAAKRNGVSASKKQIPSSWYGLLVALRPSICGI